MSKGERSPDGAQKAESGVRGRSSKSNTTGRFEKLRNERFDDGWEAAPDDRPGNSLNASIASRPTRRNSHEFLAPSSQQRGAKKEPKIFEHVLRVC